MKERVKVERAGEFYMVMTGDGACQQAFDTQVEAQAYRLGYEEGWKDAGQAVEKVLEELEP